MIYVMGTRSDGVVKIGTAVDPTSRLRQIQAGHPEPLEVLLALPGDRHVEKYLHERFADRRVSAREWFDFRGDDAVTAVVAALSAREPSPPAEQPQLPTPQLEESPRLKVYVVGVKGGVGTTTSAICLALAFAKSRMVVLVDDERGTAALWRHDANTHTEHGTRGWPEAVRVVTPDAQSSTPGDIEIIDCGRWCDADIPRDGVVVLVSTPGKMERRRLHEVLSEPRPRAESMQGDAFGVLIAIAGARDCDGAPVDDEAGMRRDLRETHPDVAVFRSSVPHREVLCDSFGQSLHDLWLGAYLDAAADIDRASALHALELVE